MDSIKYYCPEENCQFNEASGRPLKTKHLLDQHIANIHSEKTHFCKTCDKSFAYHWQLTSHEKSCGRLWTCLTCDKTYSERLSLVVHCKRSSHQLPEDAILRRSPKAKRKDEDAVRVIIVPILIPAAQLTPVQRPILPKPNSFEASSNIETQTEPTNSTCSCSSKQVPATYFRSSSQTATQTDRQLKARASRGAQCTPIRKRVTRKRKSDQFTESIETQTHLSSLSVDLEKSNITTSTVAVGPKKNATKVSVAVETGSDVMPPPLISNESNPIFTQLLGSLIPGGVISEQSVQTEDVELEAYSTIETQTTFTESTLIAEEAMGCEEDFFFDLDVNDIETQTHWNSDETTQTDANTSFPEFDVESVLKELFREDRNLHDTDGSCSQTAEIETQTQFDWGSL